jgi:dihydrofolate synthase/folylpolyglutamate synthase
VDLAGALAYLDAHVNLEAIPARQTDALQRRLDRMRDLVGLLGDPQRAYPVIHLTGTNGKGSTARILTALLTERGLSVGTYTSPHLERVNERLAWNDETISDAEFVEVLEAVSLVEAGMGASPSYFEIVTAAALRWFADVAVDVAVVEVGLGGRWDATNVVDASVAAVTNVSLDHMEYLGTTLEEIALEKAGIIKAGSRLVLGETEPAMAEIFRRAATNLVWTRGDEFDCEGNVAAYGGRLIDVHTPFARHDEVYLSLHGAHQGDNAAVALAAAESFFDAALGRDAVENAFARVRVPGRLEIMGRRPLCLLDGAHNPAGARALAESLADEFGSHEGRIFVVGFLEGRDPAVMLRSLEASGAKTVLACEPPSPRAIPVSTVLAAADSLGIHAIAAGSPEEAVARALAEASPAEQVVITGSLYLVGAARAALRRGP